jgi:hypothetical protein
VRQRALAVAVAPGRRLLAAGAVVVAYRGAARLVEPLRGEADQPDASRQLPWRWGDLILLHTVTPILVLTAIGLAASVALALAGLVPVPALGMAAAACLPDRRRAGVECRHRRAARPPRARPVPDRLGHG